MPDVFDERTQQLDDRSRAARRARAAMRSTCWRARAEGSLPHARSALDAADRPLRRNGFSRGRAPRLIPAAARRRAHSWETRTRDIGPRTRSVGAYFVACPAVRATAEEDLSQSSRRGFVDSCASSRACAGGPALTSFLPVSPPRAKWSRSRTSEDAFRGDRPMGTADQGGATRARGERGRAMTELARRRDQMTTQKRAEELRAFPGSIRRPLPAVAGQANVGVARKCRKSRAPPTFGSALTGPPGEV